METWQVVLAVFLFLLPMALLLDFWPHRERFNYSGRPVPRDWERQIVHRADDEDARH